jgi:FkbH-like protein
MISFMADTEFLYTTPRNSDGFFTFFQAAETINTEYPIPPVTHKTIKVSLLSSFTIKGFQEILLAKCFPLKIFPQFYAGGYNQYAQEILNPHSELYAFFPSLVILFIDTHSLMGDLYLEPYRLNEEQRKSWVQEKTLEIQSFLEALKKFSQAFIILNNFEIPTHSPLGILENKQTYGFIESLRQLNTNLQAIVQNDTRIFLFDYDLFCSRIGKENLIDPKMYYLGDIKLSFNCIPRLADEYMGYIKPLMSLTKKCLVLDLDNTLWGGIVGEDGIEGVKLGPSPEGRPFWEFQQYLFSLSQRGVLLAVNSRNNPEEALKAINTHPFMLLRENQFASLKINWNDKASNLAAIAEELNIGLESLVFIDDDPVNRELISKTFPQVQVVELPADPSGYLTTLMGLNDFNVLQITVEDKTRNASYVADRKRSEFKAIKDLETYLLGLETVVTVEQATFSTIPRIAQLTQRTNQFNMTSRRLLEEDVKNLIKNPQFLILTISVRDRFGDYGLIGAAIIKKDTSSWRIDNLLMSCRVIGRDIERLFLAHILSCAKESRAEKIIGEFIPTAKNIPARDFYRSNEFKLQDEKNELQIWEYPVSQPISIPKHLRLVIK